jgi:hypothetical protein
MKQYDQSFKNIEHVTRLLGEQPPSVIAFDKEASLELENLGFELEQYRDAIVGYASWYVRRSAPENIVPEAFVNKHTRDLVTRFLHQKLSVQDQELFDKIKKLLDFVDQLTGLIFIQ